jgi:hypothetical protein
MFYQPITSSTDNYVAFDIGQNCNFQINNLSLTNWIDISSNSSFADIAQLQPNTTLTLDQNSFPYTKIYIKSHVPSSPANFQFWAW